MKAAYIYPASVTIRLRTERMMALSRIDSGGTTITDKEEFLSNERSGSDPVIWKTVDD